MPTVERLKLAALIVGVVLLLYSIRADDETVRLIAIGVLVVGLFLRFAKPRKGEDGESAQ
ncbi:MAG: hypothetical protein ABI877_06480 [Gemmatimonadaceae bacterium]